MDHPVPMVEHWIATTKAAPCLWLEYGEFDASEAGAPSTALPEAASSPPLVSGDDGIATSRGYQWKQVFLPNGTELRVVHGGRSTYAKVEDEQIISDGTPTTPSRLANVRGCGTRNAWRTIWLRFPGTSRWQQADQCRR
ncbi:hypothetical protein GJ699_19665 [Duganella sp. FT80W]|uniref:Uncharacterized protein n=1 Tax=Duganella guangzhouensis TaxID=2666084 RepID=A0A6I2L6C0_9BURK|nr:hypothetical protein [Duganella guangzhouensis]MRW92216.1 hypothetical protein [Duganella guangzhouensis]